MSTWRVRKHYGFGAAQLPLQAEMHRASDAGLRDGLGILVGEITEGGPIAATRRLAGQLPALVLGLLLLGTFAVTLARDRADQSGIEVVMLAAVPPEPVPPPVPERVPEPPPPIEIVEQPPPPEPEVIEPEPAPPPQLAERPKPPPRAKPRPRPAPVMPQVARIEPPKPPPVARPDRPERSRPAPIERPRVAIDQVAQRPDTPQPTLERRARIQPNRPEPMRAAPALSAPAAPAMSDTPAPTREFRVAKAAPTPGRKPRAMPGVAPVRPRSNTPPPVADQRPQRSRPVAPTSRPTRRAPAPAMSASAAPRPSAAPALPAPTRQARDLPTSPQRSARRPAAAPAAAPRIPTVAPQALASRADRTTKAAPSGPSNDRPGLAGVPLGDLAACLSDRDEDRLKQAVVAAVKTQEECVSRKGTYRFIETKNLNAFLMWIDRAPGGAAGDRCAELTNALECLHGASQRAAR